MTAINLFQDGFRAYIATDGAYFCPKTGCILGMGSKTVMFPAVNMAIAISGRMLPDDLVKSLDQVCNQLGQHAILKALPDALRVMSGSYGNQSWENARLWIATYDKVRAKPRLYAIASDFDPSAPEAEPMKLREISGWTTGLTPVQLGQVLPEGYVTDPRGDACRLLAAQRHHEFEQAGGKHCVAGTCEMYTISRKGVVAERILSFPEKVGEVVDPKKPGHVLHADPATGYQRS